ncbi:ABC transporter permease subunit [Mycolicibacillus trivialis]|uniref:ABC transporter permease n=1 Tax=Mycolicibacillus trivialis TaxID=1798 RepID=A0A1X2ENF0_9MYCO|nr:ABC transporter permease subunit [Mycolicibacillus trivialis]ORX07265.1 ABC transporter permease [Mycolicibacillus trivialis]
MGDIALLDLRLRRRLTLGYMLGMAAYTAVVIALYPTFKDAHGLDALVQDSGAVAALFGATDPLTSPAGWLGANLYGNFLPLLTLMATIGYGATAIAGQNEEGTLALVASLPVRRARIAMAKLAALAVQALPVPVATAACIVAGRGLDLNLGAAQLWGATAGVVGLGLVFGALALLLGALTGSRGVALGVTTGAAAVSYLVNSLAPLIDWLEPGRYFSPFFYAVGDHQLRDGQSPAWLAVLGGAALVLAGAAVIAFRRLDVR